MTRVVLGSTVVIALLSCVYVFVCVMHTSRVIHYNRAMRRSSTHGPVVTKNTSLHSMVSVFVMKNRKTGM